MRNVRRSMAAASGLAVFGALGWMMGCSASPQEDLTDPTLARSTTATTSASSSSSTGGNPGCLGVAADIMSPATIANFVNDDCGVFVRADAANVAGDGTKDKPFKTVQAAIDGAKGKAIFMCANDPFVETLSVTEPLYLYGGFDCTKGWSWDLAARSTLTGKADEIPISIAAGAKDAKIWNVAIKAANATKDSGSSIGMAIDAVSASLTRCDVTAGAGKDGTAGMSYTVSAASGASAAKNVAAACTQAFAALPGATMCNGVATDGGAGGLGGITGTDSGHGQSGSDGVAGMDGKGGLGEGQPTAPLACVAGAAGTTGIAGKIGSSGKSTGNKLLLGGVTGGEGGDGHPGFAGQGGGGGGGSKAGLFCGAAMMSPGDGPGGGGGGAGGCGGLGGGGGKFGGSSVAIVSLGIQLTLTDVTLTTGVGGKGGGGGVAQVGGTHGQGAIGGTKAIVGFNNACDGGNGGDGGAGGDGGGGRGGHSIGVAFAGSPAAKPTVKFTGGAAGDGGLGADKGVGTAAAACWDFSTNATCAN